MQIIKTVAALNAVTDPSLHPLLARYADMVDLAELFIVEPPDTLDAIQRARGWSFEDWEFIHHHASGWYEAVFVLSDDGFGHVVLVPDHPDTDPAVLQLCRDHSEPAEP